MQTILIILMTMALFNNLSVGAGTDILLEVRLVRYTNPLHTLNVPPQCCDGADPPLACTINCDNKFVLCLRTHSNITQDIAGSCNSVNYVSTRPISSDDIMFDNTIQLSRGQPTDSASNPLQYTVSDWLAAAQFVVEVIDSDDPMGPENDQHIDTILVDLSALSPSTTFTPSTPHTGALNHSTLELSFRLTCPADLYGPGCSVLCVPQDSASGHYHCDPQGGMVCNEGYIDESTGCVQCMPAPTCSPVGGYCAVPGDCLCRLGYSGVSCDIDDDPCGHTAPCMNEGVCSNAGPGQYNCSCAPQYSGGQCQYNISSPCSAGSCLNGAICQSGACVCVDGYSGDQCQYKSYAVSTPLVVALVLCLSLVIIIITITIIILICCMVRARQRDKTKMMTRMDVSLPPSTDTIELQRNPGYALLDTGSHPHYCSHAPSLHVGNRPHPLPQSQDTPTDPQDYGYVNEGLGPRDTPTKTRHQSVPLRPCPQPALDEGNYAIPHRHNSSAKLIG